MEHVEEGGHSGGYLNEVCRQDNRECVVSTGSARSGRFQCDLYGYLKLTIDSDGIGIGSKQVFLSEFDPASATVKYNGDKKYIYGTYAKRLAKESKRDSSEVQQDEKADSIIKFLVDLGWEPDEDRLKRLREVMARRPDDEEEEERTYRGEGILDARNTIECSP